MERCKVRIAVILGVCKAALALETSTLDAAAAPLRRLLYAVLSSA
jgi:hypothetical protein